MKNTVALIVAVAASTLSLGASVPSHAQSPAQLPAFQAVPATPMTKASSMIIGEVMWSCGAGGCTTPKSNARPAIVCAQTVRKLGKLESFTAAGQAFDADALAKCNARARS